MGQGFLLVNYDKGEAVDPHDLGLGYKVGEFGSFQDATDFLGSLTQFARELTAQGGEWHGDRVAFVGDYGDAYAVDGSLASSDAGDYDLPWRLFPRERVRDWVRANADPTDLAWREAMWRRQEATDLAWSKMMRGQDASRGRDALA